jgi:thiol:disulfide interchange protein DsbC
MCKIKYVVIIMIIHLPAVSFAVTQKGHGGKCSSCHSLTITEANRLVKDIGGSVKNVKLSPVAGLFELFIEKDGRQVTAYMDFGKKYIIPGPIFSLATRKPINATAAKGPATFKKVNVDKITTNYSIIMGNPKGKKKLFVFTDPDCPYCAKLHVELKKLAARDHSLSIHIKMFPLQMHPQAYDKARVILGRNSLELLDKAFAGLPLPPPSLMDSKKPVDETINLAVSLGINATPTLVLPDGRVIPGYWDAPTLQKYISGKM